MYGNLIYLNSVDTVELYAYVGIEKFKKIFFETDVRRRRVLLSEDVLALYCGRSYFAVTGGR